MASTQHRLSVWLNETIWKLTDEGKMSEESKLMLGEVMGFHDIADKIDYMTTKCWLIKK